MKKQAAILCDEPAHLPVVYGEKTLAAIRELVELRAGVLNSKSLEQNDLSEIEVLFSTWGMPRLAEAQLERLPKLKVLFYAAGATEGFVRPLLRHGILCSSAWQANAIPVAEFTFAQILLGLKGVQRLSRRLGQERIWARDHLVGPGAYGARVGLIGDGAIARRVCGLLGNCDVEVVMMPSDPASRSISLEELFRTCQVVSNHLPNRADNAGTVTRKLLETMPYGGVFINTGRARQVDQEGLIQALRSRLDLTAILDVFPQEPLPRDSELFELPNVFLTPHVAGSLNDECRRMGEYMLDELRRYLRGEPLRYRVIEELLMPEE